MGKNHGFRENQQGFAAGILSMEKNLKIVGMRLITQQYFHGQKKSISTLHRAERHKRRLENFTIKSFHQVIKNRK